jgi:hypothetical protein
VKRLNTSVAPREEYDYFSSLGTDMCLEAEVICNGTSRERPRDGIYYRIE